MTDQERNNTPERKAYMKAYHQANQEKVKKHKRSYEERNPEKVRESRKRYREASRDKKKAYYQVNKEAINAKNRAYYEANREALRAQQKIYQDAHREEINLRQQATRYAVSPDTITAMCVSQDDRCMICKTPFTLVKLNVDHCHETGVVRGLLCAECNRGLSCFKDNPKALRNAIKYLADSKKRTSPA